MANQEIEVKLAQSSQGIGIELAQARQSIGVDIKSGGGLSEVFHDETLKGKGTFADRLGIADVVLEDIASKATETALQAETDARVQADEQLQANIDTVAGNLETEIQQRKQDIEDLSEELASEIQTRYESDSALSGRIDGIQDTIDGYGNIVTHNVSEFATSAQGIKADTAIQPNDNISSLTNDVGYITKSVNNLDNYTTTTVLNGLLSNKQDTISDLTTIRSNAQAGKNASDTIATYGDIVTHNVSEFATSAQGAKSDTAIQPNDNVSELTNDAGYITKSVNNLDNYTTTTALNGLLDQKQNTIDDSNKLSSDLVDDTNHTNKFVTTTEKTTWNNKQDKLIPGDGISIENNVITNTRTSAEWGKIAGNIQDQTDLKESLDAKQDKLTEGNAGANINITYSGGGSVLPQGYVQYTFMESTGTQVVNAGTVSNGEWVEIVFSPTVIAGSATGAYTGVAGKNSAPQMGYYPGGWTSGNASSAVPYLPESGRIYTYKWTSSNGRFYIDDVWTNLARSGTLTLNLFQCESSSKSTRIYEVRKYNANNELILHLYPALESSSFRNGMYDIVNNVFYPSNVNLTPGDKIRGENVIISADLSDYATSEDLTQGLAQKQDTLVSGTNIKTVNNESLLGSGNIDITSAQWGKITGTLSNQTDLKNALDNKTQVIIRRW